MTWERVLFFNEHLPKNQCITAFLAGIAVLFLAFSGIIAGYCNFIRSHSGTCVLLFILAWVLLNEKLSKSHKLQSLAVLVAFTCLPFFHFNVIESKRDKFLVDATPNYRYVKVKHPFWHAVYLGLGYLKNDHGIQWSDRIALEKAQSIKPDVVSCSDEYETILKDQFLNIAKSDPLFLIKTLLAKSWVVLLRIIQFANFGLLALFYIRPPSSLLFPFILSGLFYSLPGVLVMPINTYLAGFTSVTTIFGIFMVNLGIEKYNIRKFARPEQA